MKERLKRILAKLEMLRDSDDLIGYNTSIEAQIYEQIVGAISVARKGIRDIEDKEKTEKLPGM